MLQAQLDQLPESGLAITSSERPVEGRRARGRKRIGVSSVASPSPRPLPWGEGESHAAAWQIERTGSCGCPGVESRSARCQWERHPTYPLSLPGGSRKIDRVAVAFVVGANAGGKRLAHREQEGRGQIGRRVDQLLKRGRRDFEQHGVLIGDYVGRAPAVIERRHLT